MKYLNRLFAYTDRLLDSESCSPAALTSSLYSVTFVSNSSRHPDHQHCAEFDGLAESGETLQQQQQYQLESQPQQTLTNTINKTSQDSVNIIKVYRGRADKRSTPSLFEKHSETKSNLHSDGSSGNQWHNSAPPPATIDDISRTGKVNTSLKCASSLDNSNRSSANLSSPHPPTQQHSSSWVRAGSTEREDIVDVNLDESDDLQDYEQDWIIVESWNTSSDHSERRRRQQQQQQQIHCSQDQYCNQYKHKQRPLFKSGYRLAQNHNMALDLADIEIIRASWVSMRKDTLAAGLLLFKCLFTKFPQYLKFFPAFADLNLDDMQEHKQLRRHSTKVIDTVTFLVDSIGDESKAEKLNEALVGLVRGHLKRNVGLPEFRSLGIVLIDFICDINQRGAIENCSVGGNKCTTANSRQVIRSSTSDSSNLSSNDTSDTMTSALDKIQGSSPPPSSSEEEEGNFLRNPSIGASSLISSNTDGSGVSSKLDTNAVVAAWTKLYSSILDLVKREELEAAMVADSTATGRRP